jgi:hypothetical protein
MKEKPSGFILGQDDKGKHICLEVFLFCFLNLGTCITVVGRILKWRESFTPLGTHALGKPSLREETEPGIMMSYRSNIPYWSV